MVVGILGFLLLAVSLLAIALQRLYSAVPARELKRLAVKRDDLAQALFRPVAYGAGFRLLLWLVFALGFSGGFLLLSQVLNAIITYSLMSISALFVVMIFSLNLTASGVRLAVIMAGPLQKVMHYLHKPLQFAVNVVGRYRNLAAHSGLYEKSDLQALLKQQQSQPDNRITTDDLKLLHQALDFGDRQAADIALSWSKIKHVLSSDHIGPILLGELHNSGQASFIVLDDAKTAQPIGTLSLRDAVAAKTGGLVGDLTRPNITYVHENFNLRQVLHALMTSGAPATVVINNFEEAVGVISLQQLLTELFTEVEAADDVAYDDRASIAAWKPQLVPQPVVDGPITDEIPDTPSTGPTEVVK